MKEMSGEDSLQMKAIASLRHFAHHEDMISQQGTPLLPTHSCDVWRV